MNCKFIFVYVGGGVYAAILIIDIMNFQLFQVIAFSDEEGVRFHSTFLGSAALAGVLPVTALQISDKRFS